MASSFRRRLLAIAAVTVVTCGGAITALLLLARTAAIERVERARDNVRHEVEGLGAVLEDVPPSERPRRDRQSGHLQSGYVAGSIVDGRGPLVEEAVELAAGTRAPVLLERAEGATPVVVAAAPVSEGGYVFALQRVVAGREIQGLRVVLLALTLLTLGLVVASLRTLAAVAGGVSTLRASLAALATDLGAPIRRPPLRELGEVADGVAALARELGRAQVERERLSRRLGEGERLAALGRVAAGIAHEVRNPLAAMKLRADLARAAGDAPPSIAKDLEDIASEIARLDRLVSDLLVLGGPRSESRSDVDIGELVGRRAALLEAWAGERHVALAHEGTGRARVDVDALSRAVDNLLRNAVEASPAGARVDVRVRDDQGHVRIDVEDRGAGVPAERAAELFEPFFTTKSQGTGLGLALARAAAAAHAGTLTYHREGDVTRFTLTLGSG